MVSADEGPATRRVIRAGTLDPTDPRRKGGDSEGASASGRSLFARHHGAPLAPLAPV